MMWWRSRLDKDIAEMFTGHPDRRKILSGLHSLNRIARHRLRRNKIHASSIAKARTFKASLAALREYIPTDTGPLKELLSSVGLEMWCLTHETSLLKELV